MPPMQTSSPHVLPYRPCVGIVLFNRAGLVFVGDRLDTTGDHWQMPQGGIDEGEDVRTAAFRELYEETGIKNAEIIRIAEEKITYDLPGALQGNLWNGRYRGQEQIWVAMRFTGDDSEINLQVHTPPEFTAWKWVPLEKTPELIIPFKRETYIRVAAMFRDTGKQPAKTTDS